MVEKNSKKMVIPNCPPDKLDEVIEISKKYCSSEDTIKFKPVSYEVEVEILNEKAIPFYNEVEEINKSLKK